MKDSEHIEEFLRFLREAEFRYKAASEDMSVYEMQLQDIEHKLELCEVSYHETAKLGKLLKKGATATACSKRHGGEAVTGYRLDREAKICCG